MSLVLFHHFQVTCTIFLLPAYQVKEKWKYVCTIYNSNTWSQFIAFYCFHSLQDVRLSLPRDSHSQNYFGAFLKWHFCTKHAFFSRRECALDQLSICSGLLIENSSAPAQYLWSGDLMTLGNDFSWNCSTTLFCLKASSCFPTAHKFHIIARAQEEVYTYTYIKVSFHIKFFQSDYWI